MKTSEFQQVILLDIKRAISHSDLSMEKLAQIAESAVALSNIYKNEIPREVILEFMQKHNEIKFSLKEDIQREQKEADDITAHELREQIKKRQS